MGMLYRKKKTAQLNGYNGGWQIEIKRGFDDFRTSQKQPIISRTFGNFFNQHPGAGFGFWTPPCRWLPLVAPQQGWKLPASWGPLANNWSLGTSLWWIYININTLSHSWWNPIYTYNYITLHYITYHIMYKFMCRARLIEINTHWSSSHHGMDDHNRISCLEPST